MGTYYAINFDQRTCSIDQTGVESILRSVNQSLSTYLPDSEISRFNRQAKQQWHKPSNQFSKVLTVAAKVSQQSGGAFDITVGPLVNLWGFGAQTPTSDNAPDATQQAAARSRVGMDKLAFNEGRIAKLHDGVFVDMSALAKGFGVDEVATLLLSSGCTSYMVDIGGELTVVGNNPAGTAWRIGIETPDAAKFGAIHTVLSLTDVSVATSGDYRNYRLVNNQRVDHVIDPRRGTPANSKVVSATVVHPLAMWADAYATTLMVLGEEEALQFARQLDLPIYLLMAQPEVAGEPWRASYNAAMQQYLVNPTSTVSATSPNTGK